jgi:FAD/FMN-containing dehydrogenase
VFTPEDAGYDLARSGFNLAVEQRPAVVVMAASERDIAAAVEFAGQEGMGVGIQATGHGIATPANAGLLINTSPMRGVDIDPASRTATVEAGAIWRDVIPKAHEYGLAPLSGSSSGVGVVGYTSGGGSGWLGRKYGYAADSVIGARVVMCNGGILDVDKDHHPDLFWAIRGGTSNFGLITRLKFRLYDVSHLYAGGIYWPIEHALSVAETYRELSASAPDWFTSRLAFVHVPPLPHVPRELHGKWLVAVQGAYLGPEADGAKLIESLRAIGGAVEDDFSMKPFSACDSIARDPHQPVPIVMHTEMLREIPLDMVRYIVEEVALPDSPLVIIEVRQQGGAFQRQPEVPSAVGIRPGGFWLNAIASTMPPGARAGAEHTISTIGQRIQQWTTGSLYLNAIDEFGAGRVKQAYSPETWDRLARVKRRYDPDNLFRFNRNIPAA